MCIALGERTVHTRGHLQIGPLVGVQTIPRSTVSLYLAFFVELSCALRAMDYGHGTGTGVLALRGGGKTYLRYWRHPEGHRVYTLEKLDPNGRPTLTAHPPPIPLTDEHSRQRVTLKLRHGLIDEVVGMEELRAAWLKKMDDPVHSAISAFVRAQRCLALLGQPDSLSPAQEAAIRRMYQEKVERGEASAHREMLWLPQQPRNVYTTRAGRDHSTVPSDGPANGERESPGSRHIERDGPGGRGDGRGGRADHFGGGYDHARTHTDHTHSQHTHTHTSPTERPDLAFHASRDPPRDQNMRSDFIARSTLPSPSQNFRAGSWDEEEEGRVADGRGEAGKGGQKASREHLQDSKGRREGAKGGVAGGLRERRLARKRERERG